MTTFVLLDSGPTGLITNPADSLETVECRRWMQQLIAHDIVVALPEIADYEIRRELLRARKPRGLRSLDRLKDSTRYLALDTTIMLQAAVFWALARQQGRPTARENDIDRDMILAVTAWAVSQTGDTATIATTSVRHVSLFADARLWSGIRER